MPKILGLWYDPMFGGQRIHSRYGWIDPVVGFRTAVEQLNSVLPVAQQYTLDTMEIDIPAAGTRAYGGQHNINDIDIGEPYRYSADEWVTLWDTIRFDGAWPNGRSPHIRSFIEENGIVERINRGQYDEVWSGGLPIPEAFEGAMIAPEGDVGAYQCHDTLVFVPGLSRRFVWHMFQIQNWNPLHNYWHRIEAIMARIWNVYGYGYNEQWTPPLDMNNVRTYWQLFTMTENCRPGEAQVGSCHFMPNSKLGYVYDMHDAVPSGAHLWKNYPTGFPLDLDRNDRWQLVNRDAWVDLPDYLWQYSHIPTGHGGQSLVHDGRWTNWWKYIVDTNESLGRDLDCSKPWIGTQRPLPNVVTIYGDRACVRWEPREGDTDDQIYRIYVDDILRDTIQRRAHEHIKLSSAVPIGTRYKIESWLKWESEYTNVAVPVPTPVPTPGGNMTLDEVKALIHRIHVDKFPNCPEPDHIMAGSGVWIIQWPNVQGGFTMNPSMGLNSTMFQMIYELQYPKSACSSDPVPPTTIPPTTVPPTPPVTPVPTIAVQWWAVRQAIEEAAVYGGPVDKLKILERSLWQDLITRV